MKEAAIGQHLQALRAKLRSRPSQKVNASAARAEQNVSHENNSKPRSGASQAPDDPVKVISEREAVFNATANIVMYLRSGDIQIFDCTGHLVPAWESKGEISGLWVRSFPTNTSKKAFLACFCALYRTDHPEVTNAAYRAVENNAYQVSANKEKGGFNIYFAR